MQATSKQRRDQHDDGESATTMAGSAGRQSVPATTAGCEVGEWISKCSAAAITANGCIAIDGGIAGHAVTVQRLA